MKSPFKFLDSYQEEDYNVYYGRDDETTDLYNTINGVKLLLVSGPSGSGKTSLIECGLRNRFSEADWYAISIRKGQNINSSLFRKVNEALIDLGSNSRINNDFFKNVADEKEKRFCTAVKTLFKSCYKPIFLLFDQFEELLISGSQKEKDKFFTYLNALIEYDIPCRIILIMREEFIGHLWEYETICPSLFKNRFRVDKMRREAVKSVISDILDSEDYKRSYKLEEKEKLTEKILKRLPANEEIELAHVQVFLNELWDRSIRRKKRNGKPVLNPKLIRTTDTLAGVLRIFLRKQLGELKSIYGDKLPLEILSVMISEEYTKLQLSKDSIEQRLLDNDVIIEHDLKAILKELEIRQILRSLKSDDKKQYEISHDLLASVVGRSRTKTMIYRDAAKKFFAALSSQEGRFNLATINQIEEYSEHLKPDNKLEAKTKKDRKFIKNRNLLVKVGYGVLLFASLFLLLRANKSRIKAEEEIRNSTGLKLLAHAYNELDLNNDYTTAFKLIKLALKKTSDKSGLISNLLHETYYDVLNDKNLFYDEELDFRGYYSNSIDITDNGRYLSSIIEDSLKIIDLANGKIKTTIPDKGNLFSHSLFSTTSRLVLTKNDKNMIGIWDIESGKNINEFITKNSFAPVYFPKDKIIGFVQDSALQGEYYKVLDIKGNIIRSIKLNNNSSFIGASYDKESLYAINENDLEIYNINNPDKDKFFTVESKSNKETSKILYFYNIPNEEKIIVLRNDRIEVLNILNGTKTTLINEVKFDSSIETYGFSPDGKILSLGFENGEISIRDSFTLKPIIELSDKHEESIILFSYNEEGNLLLSSSEDKTVKLWDLESGQLLNTIEDQSRAIAFFKADQKSIFSISADLQLKFWNLATDYGIYSYTLPNDENSIVDAELSKDSKSLVVGLDNGELFLLNRETSKKRDFEGHQDEILSVKLSSNGNTILSTSEDGKAVLWDVNKENKKLVLPIKGDAYYADFFDNESKIITVSTAPEDEKDENVGFIHIWDFKNDSITEKKKIKFKDDEYLIKAEVSPDNEHILIVHDSRIDIMNIYDTTIVQYPKQENIDNFYDEILYAEFSKDGSNIIITLDFEVVIWDWKSNSIIDNFQDHADTISSAVYSSNDDQILSFSDDETFRIMDTKTGNSKSVKINFNDDLPIAVKGSYSSDFDEIVLITETEILIYPHREKINDWLNNQNPQFNISNQDLERLGIDFIEIDD